MDMSYLSFSYLCERKRTMQTHTLYETIPRVDIITLFAVITGLTE